MKTAHRPPARRQGQTYPDQLLARILETPDLAQAVPRLHPELLQRIVRFCGLEDCGALVSMATPGQLSAVFDLDLWHSPRPGVDEQFDAERFSVWLEVLLESGDTVAADTFAAIDSRVLTAALAQYVYVFDRAALGPPALKDDDDEVGVPSEPDRWCDISGYRVKARRHDTWDATVALLRSLDAEHHDYFDRVMMECRRLSDSAREIDGLDQLMTATDQFVFNCAVEREGRREQQGYVTPAQAGAFLRMSRTTPHGTESTRPSGNPIASAYFRAMAWTDDPGSSPQSGVGPSSETPPMSDAASAGAARLVGLLVDAGVLPERPRALLDAAEGSRPRLVLLRALLESARERDGEAYALRNQELGYLANVLMAGCVIQSRAFTGQEALEAAYAVCNLGLHSWPVAWLAQQRLPRSADAGATSLPVDFLVEQDLVSVFQVGWTTLHEQVCMFAAGRLVDVLRSLRVDDREVQAGLRALVKDLAAQSLAGVPWRARQSFEVLAILDMPTWAALLSLIDECPTLHGGIAASTSSGLRSVSSTAFEFIAEPAQIVAVGEFMSSVASRLR